MKKSKIFLSIILVVVAAFALTACGTLDFTYVQNSDGTYTHIVKVTLTEEGVKSADVELTLDEAVNALKEGFIRKDYFVSADGNTVTARKNFDSVQALQNDLIGNGIITNDVKKDENAFVVKQTIFGDIKVSGKFISTNTWWFAGVLTSGGLSQINAEKIALKLEKADTSYNIRYAVRIDDVQRRQSRENGRRQLHARVEFRRRQRRRGNHGDENQGRNVVWHRDYRCGFCLPCLCRNKGNNVAQKYETQQFLIFAHTNRISV